MITSAENRPRRDDIPFGDAYSAAGLPAPSVVRACKLATIEASHADRLGTAPAEVASATLAIVRRYLDASGRG
jgi:mRNA interferase MazF